MPKEEGVVARARRAELAALVFGALALASRVAVASGASPVWLTTTLGAAATASILTAIFGGGRWLDAFRLPLVLVALWSLPSVHPRLGGDGYEYYVTTRSLLFDHDLDLANDFAGLGARPIKAALGGVANRTPMGVGLLWTPAILLTHVAVTVAAALGADVIADGFSEPYQAAATTTTFLFGALTLALADTLLRRLYPRAIALLVGLALWFATPLHFYSVAAPFMSHGCSAFAGTLFVFLWLSWRQSDERRRWILLGLWGGFMTLVRIQDGVLLVLPFVDIGLRRPPGWFRRLGFLLIGPAVAGLLQALLWARLWGNGFVGQVGKTWFSHGVNVMGVLFSSRHGLFTWTPVWALAVLGFVLWVRRDRRLALLMAMAFSLAVVVNGSLADWWGSDGFGQRRFLGLTGLFALGLAEVVELLRARPLLPVALILGGLALWNEQFAVIYNAQMVAARSEPIPLDRLAPAQVDLLWRRLFAWRDHLPGWLLVLGHDNLKGVWIDEGRPAIAGIEVARPGPEPPLFLGPGWRRPQSEEGLRFCSTRGRRSWLTVLLKTPGDFRLLLRARSAVAGETVGVSVEVNETPVGEALATASWSDLEFRVPSAAVRPGLNQLLLKADKTARSEDPAHQAKSTALSVERLRLERIEGEKAP